MKKTLKGIFTMKTKTQKIVFSALLASFVCVATMIIKIPSPLKGYINLGDCVVLLCGWTLSPMYAFLAAGVGSGLADLFAGYAVYVPVTFVIKGAMALVAYFGLSFLKNKLGNVASYIIGGLAAELVMILGYYVFEGFLYGFVPSVVNIPANGVQGLVGLVLGIVLARIFDKNKIL